MHSSSQPFALRSPPPPAPPSQSQSPAVAAAPNHAKPPPPPSTRAAPQLAKPRGAVASAAAPSIVPVAGGVLPASTIAQAGLPLLPSHAASTTIDPARALQPLAWSAASVGVVDMFGDVGSRDSVRAKLLRFYEDTHQVRRRGSDSSCAGDSSKPPNGSNTPCNNDDNDDGVSEMTLRIDTELELLRQQCFAERNAQWDYHTPEMFEYEPASEPLWAPQLVGNAKIALRRLKHDAPTERDEREAIVAAVANGSYAGVAVPGVAGVVTKVDARGFPLGQFSRERPWPPREFTQKAAVRAPRGRGGKRKVPVVVLEERSEFSKLCAECHTQTTPLWRKLARDGDAWIAVKSEPATTTTSESPAAVATTTAATTAENTVAPPAPVPVALDVCLACFLKLQRGDLFVRKALEREQKVRERQERAAQLVLLEKKRLKQQQQLAKKQQLALAQAAKSKKRRPSVVTDSVALEPVDAPGAAVAAVATPVVLKLVIKTESSAAPVKADPVEAAAVADSSAAVDNTGADAAAEELAVKRERKKSKKEKKKKKKKRRRVEVDSDSDSATPLPSPPQMVGHYEYADLGSERSRAPFDPVDPAALEREPVQVPQPAIKSNLDEDAASEKPEASTPSKRARKTLSRSESTASAVTPPTTVASPSSSSTVSKSRKRRNSAVPPPVVKTEDATPEMDEPVRLNARPSRAKTPVAAVASAAVTPASAAGKRTRTKKESARERELRALGQYCPVCNAVYEEDDDSTFVCCDSCEMWVHGSCDTTLTPASIAALAESNDKYICPLCAGR